MGAGAVPAIGPELGMGIRAFHGSPHDFDRFDMSKIGTGEGAQAYGHGLYFAENEGVARSYRDTLAQQVSVGGKPVLANNRRIGTTGDEAVDEFLVAHNGDLDAAIDDVRKIAAEDRGTPSGAYHEQLLPRLEALRGQVESRNTGRMYEVEIDASPDEFLDWDKPINQQPEKVKSALNIKDDMGEWVSERDRYGRPLEVRRSGDGQVAKIMLSENGRYYDVRVTPPNGDYYSASRANIDEARAFADQYQRLGGRSGSSWASGNEDKLREAGVPGIRYRDQFSRGMDGAETGTHNYVVFDDKLVKILRKYGLPLTAGGLATLTQIAPEEAQAAQ